MPKKTAQPAEYVLEVEDLVVEYGRRRILDGISMNVRAGEIMVIMGGSGSGKSTLLRHLLGLEVPAGGTVRMLGRDVSEMTNTEMDDLRQHVGVSFQSGALFTSMSVGENVALPLRERQNLDDNTIRIMTRLKLELVSLAGFENLMPSQLSGGMIKRAAFARAIVMDPKLVFFDEPSAGLDPVVSAELDELIIKLRDALGTTIIVVTHELESAFRIADRITVLDHGRVLVTDTVDAVRNCQDQRVQDLLNRTPREMKIDADDYLRRLTEEEPEYVD
ncbi:MAG: ATP-binding cassette domain-containing protein [Gammaproteobacteria bacterium]|nr:MAG: ATP-binding cassette domain-containing protein [Gammaproteobacteria bacterium]